MIVGNRSQVIFMQSVHDTGKFCVLYNLIYVKVGWEYTIATTLYLSVSCMIVLNSCSKLSSQTSLITGLSVRLCICIPLDSNVSLFKKLPSGELRWNCVLLGACQGLRRVGKKGSVLVWDSFRGVERKLNKLGSQNMFGNFFMRDYFYFDPL